MSSFLNILNFQLFFYVLRFALLSSSFPVYSISMTTMHYILSTRNAFLDTILFYYCHVFNLKPNDIVAQYIILLLFCVRSELGLHIILKLKKIKQQLIKYSTKTQRHNNNYFRVPVACELHGLFERYNNSEVGWQDTALLQSSQCLLRPVALCIRWFAIRVQYVLTSGTKTKIK